ncbi:UNVERIFIED_CONTAM: ATP-dependent DNA helicase, chloroplastic [Sesamum radiatum]|uniref:ATP-dependent DNA helicase, chloroplastic n=1 Tax=Sesamum radiatum TaxID=300843 RepID=A0AAW2MEG9_SESRA
MLKFEMATAKTSGFCLSTDAVAVTPCLAAFIERTDYNRVGNAKHWPPLSLSSVRFGLRFKVRGVLSSSPWSPPLTPPDVNGNGRSVPSKIRTQTDSEQRDSISLLNERIRREHCKRESQSSRPSMDSEEADMYIQLVKEQQQKGLQKLKGDRRSAASGAFSYKVDPYTLRSGDYVVHKKVGIGRFVGVKFDVSKASSEPIEYVFIEYADGMAKLPVKQASRMLYRYNLCPDLPSIKKSCMADFAAQFPYEPTPDQKQAFMDVERDLTERENPMDRLICGDVGFGKTEVALRAIFCVVSAGKQAMVLAPTIVLAKQHFDVISERFSRYHNIKVGLLSRFQVREIYFNFLILDLLQAYAG